MSLAHSAAATPQDTVLYFAYGSNMNEGRLRERLSRSGQDLLERRCAALEGYRLAFDKVSSQQGWVGFANIVPCPDGRVEGTLNAMRPAALDALDAIELVPHHYHRRRVLVRDATGVILPALTYVAHPDMVRANLKPTRDYIDHLLAGGDILPGEYLELLRGVECWT